MEQLEFYDIVKKKKFKTSNYTIKKAKNTRTKRMIKFAIAKSPFTGKKCARILKGWYNGNEIKRSKTRNWFTRSSKSKRLRKINVRWIND